MSEERLKRIEILLETCAKTAVANREDIKLLTEQKAQDQAEIREVRQQVNQLTVQMASLSDMFTESVRIMRTMQSDIKTMQSEVKGLQTENKRMLDHLFGENEN